METTKKHFFSDMGVMLGRSMRHIFRSLDTIITVTITPIAMMLLFVYVLGGAIKTGTDNYVNYLLPGILLIAIASGISYTAYRLFMDMQSGIFERFHSMPIARSAALWGHVPFPTRLSFFRLSVRRLCLPIRCRRLSALLLKISRLLR